MTHVTDHALASRLETTEGRANVAYIEARARISPEVGATWREIGGTLAMFDGPSSFISQTFGLGMSASPTHEILAELEAFFVERGAVTMHETCPLADPSLLTLLPDRGYRPVEQSSVMYRPLERDPRPASLEALRVRTIEPGEASLWAQTAAAGWSDTPEAAAFVLDFGRIAGNAAGMHCLVAEWEGTPAGAGGLFLHEGVALLAGASTVPAFRRRGVQAALLAARLALAAEAGCELAMVCAAPGSASQRNAERRGFRIGYTRTKWMRPRDG